MLPESAAARDPLLVPASRSDPVLIAHEQRVKKRIPLLDNARTGLIYLVVLYHMAVVFTTADRPEASIAYWSGFILLLKPVVMPSFCLISGHLSRSNITLARLLGLCQLLVTYVIFQVLFHFNNLLGYRLNGFPYAALPLQVFQPEQQVVTWFLFALVTWRIALPVMVRLRAPMVTALVLGHAAIFVDLGANYQNVLAFLPYFVAGHLLPPSVWSRLEEARVRVGLGAFLSVVAVALILFSSGGGALFASADLAATVTYGCMNGITPGDSPRVCVGWEQLPRRALFYVSSAPLLAGFFCLVPRGRGVWSVPGYMSMYVYLIHPLLITNPLVMHWAFAALSQHYGREITVWSPATDFGACAVLSLVALLVTVLLSLPLTRMLASPLVEPPIHRLFRQTTGAVDDAVSKPEDSRSRQGWGPATDATPCANGNAR